MIADAVPSALQQPFTKSIEKLRDWIWPAKTRLSLLLLVRIERKGTASWTVILDKQTLEGELPPPNQPTEGTIHNVSNQLLTYVAPQSPQQKLERFFDTRPSPTDLKQRNILKDSKLAPSLQSAEVPHSPSHSSFTDNRPSWKGNVLKMNYLQNYPFDLKQMNLWNNISSIVFPLSEDISGWLCSRWSS